MYVRIDTVGIHSDTTHKGVQHYLGDDDCNSCTKAAFYLRERYITAYFGNRMPFPQVISA